MKFKITLILSLFVSILQAQPSWQGVGSAPFSALVTDEFEMIIRQNGRPVVAYVDPSSPTDVQITEWNGSTWQMLPMITPTVSPDLTDLNLVSNDNNIYLGIGSISGMGYEVYRLDGGAWVSIDDSGQNLLNLNYTPNTVKLAVSEQINNICLTYSSIGGTGDLPNAMLYDLATPGEWDPSFGDDLNTLFATDTPNETNSLKSKLFQNGPNTYYFSIQSDPAQGPLNQLRLYKYDSGTWQVLQHGAEDFIQNDPHLFTMDGNQAGGFPTIAYTENGQPDVLKIQQMDGAGNYNPLPDFNTASALNATDLSLDNSGNPYIGLSFGTSSNKLIHFNGSAWDVIGADFHVGSVSEVDLEVFKSSNKVYVLFMTDGGLKIKTYNNNPQVMTSPTIVDICEGAGASTVVSDLEVTDVDHDSVYVISAISSNQTLLPNANITINRTSTYDFNSSANHFEVIANPAAAQTGSVSITIIYSDGLVTDSEVISFTVNASPTVITNGNFTLCEGTNVTLIGGGASTYTWDNSVIDGVSFLPGLGSPGSYIYTVTGTDANGCQGMATSNVIVTPLPTFSVTANDILCFGTNDGELIINGLLTSQSYDVWYDQDASPMGPFTISSDATGKITISPLSQGTYENVVVMDNSTGCTSSSNAGPYTIIEPNQITILTEADQIHCEGTPVTLNGNGVGGTGILAYTWNNGVIDGSPFTPAVGTLSYEVTATDQNGCLTTDIVLDITVNAIPPVFTISQTNPTSCGGADGSITIEGVLVSTLYDVAYDDGSAQNIPSTTSDASGNILISGLTAGNYSSFDVTNTNGCMTSLAGPVSLSDPGSPTINPIISQTVCANSDFTAVTFSGTAGATFTWTNDNTSIGLPASGTGDISAFTGVNAGTTPISSSFTVTPTLGGCTGLDEFFTLTINPLDDAGFTYSSTSLCEDEALSPSVNTNTAGGTFNYAVVSGGPTLMLNTTNGTIGIPSSNVGNYDVTYTTTGACPNSSTENISINASPVITITQPLIEICNNASPLNMSGIATPTGGTYSGIGISNNYFNPNPLPVDGYSYTYNYTDANGCSSSNIGTVGILEIPDISLNLTNTTCGNKTGSAISTVTGGLAPYDYYWSNGTNGPEITGLGASTYYLNVTDANNCYVMDVAAIQSDEIDIIYSSVYNQCAGESNGELDLIITGTTGPYTYFWSNGATTEDITGLANGQYEVFVTDADGCTSSHTTEIQSPGEFTNEITTTLPSSCGALDGSLLATIQGAVPAYSYEWKNEVGTIVGTNALLSNIGQGVYTLKVTDFVGCTEEYNAVLTETGAPEISIDQITSASCVDDGAIDISINSTNTITSTVWSNLATTEDISGLTNGFYSVKVTDDNGCVGNLGVNVDPLYPDYVDICMVTVNENTNTNLVVWEKPVTTEIDHFIVYRETSVAGQFLPVGTVDYDDESLFTDPVAYPQLRSWRYKLGVVNTCGVPSALSPAHKTMHITISQEVGGVYTINWDNYEGFTFPTFDVYRFTDVNGWELLSAAPTSTFSYTDTPPSTIGLDYMVSITPPTVCTSSKAQDHNASRSNTTSSISIGPGDNTGNTDGITEFELENTMLIYPNPSASFFNVHMNVDLSNAVIVNVYDIKGSIVQSFVVDRPDFIVQLKDFENGMYILEINTGHAIVRKQLIKK